MLGILSKSQYQISWEDIQILYDKQITESQELEFKGLICKSEKNKQSKDEKIEIDDPMKNQICRTIAAFANSHGGALILGVEDSSDSEEPNKKLGIIGKVTSIPNCKSFVDNLSRTVNDRIEPCLPKLEVFPVFKPESEKNDEGVIVLRTKRSNHAVHCVKFKSSSNKKFPTKTFPTRRGSNTVELTTQELQDLILNLSWENKRIEATKRTDEILNNRSENFSEEINKLGDTSLAWGVRMTAMPTTDDVQFGEVQTNGNLLEKYTPDAPPPNNPPVRYQNEDMFAPCYWKFTKFDDPWHPILEAAKQCKLSKIKNENGLPHTKCYREIHNNGLIENGYLYSDHEIEGRHPNIPKLYCFMEWLIYLFSDHLAWVDKARRSADCIYSEYAVNVEVEIIGDNLHIWKKANDCMGEENLAELPLKNSYSYTYEFNSHSQINNLIYQFLKNLSNTAKYDISISPSEIEILNLKEYE